MSRKPTTAQLSALRWLKNNNGLEVPNMDTAGKAREWPQARTLHALVSQGWATFEQRETTWRVAVSETGLALESPNPPKGDHRGSR